MLNPTIKTTRILTEDNHLLIVQKMSASELLSCAILDINSIINTTMIVECVGMLVSRGEHYFTRAGSS